MRISKNSVFDKDGRKLARLVDYGDYKKVERTPCCSIGDYFAILVWLMEKHGEITVK